ncbi:calcium-binding protein [Thalassospira alkalitolerans]|uniref:calcium-binding protein n=1 Tax=Thalassospira alkalitolerans TaxID=1293890 RepID=UPI003AA8C8B1
MTITIDLNADTSGNGVDLHAVLEDFDANFALGSSNHGTFYDGLLESSYYGGTQFLATDLDASSTYTGSVLASAGSTDFAYNISNHTITGNLDSLSFGSTLGLDGAGTQFAFSDSSVDISGLNLSDSQTNDVLVDIYTGDIDALESVLASEGVEINGSTGADVIGGWAGDDVLTGNAGADTFEFDTSASFGDDTVTDFDDGTDVLDIDFASVTIADDGAGNALITHANGTVTLTGVDFNDLDASDFV